MEFESFARRRWRLILGESADPGREAPLEGTDAGMDRALDLLYDADRRGTLGKSSPTINRWLGDIRKYFPAPVVQVMQRDALERLDLKQMLLEPELLSSVEPDVHLVGTLLQLSAILPAQTRDTAREVVRRVVDDLEKRLHHPLRQALMSALNRSARNRRPRLNEIDWHRTIRQNLRHYQPDLGAIIPERLAGFGRKGRSLKHIILLVDQSGSMASSVVYASVFSAALASLRAIETRIVVFDTAVVDLSEKINDPVDLLFSTQLGGGTDINKALGYAQSVIRQPSDTILVLISDLFEGGPRAEMLKKVQALTFAGVTLVALLALNDEGAPAFDRENAAAFTALGVPAFACTPEKFPEIMATAVKGELLTRFTA